MSSTVQVVLVAVVVAEAVGLVVLGVLVRLGLRRERRLREEVLALQQPAPRRRTPRRLVPRPDETVKALWETATLVREKGVGVALRSSVLDLAGWAQVELPDLVQLAGADGTMAILFSDIEGSTSLNEQLGDKQWVRLLARHDRAVRSRVEQHGGHVVKTQGDGFMVAFASSEQAVRCAISVQQAFDRGRASHPTPILLRIGIHRGDVVHRDNDIFGRHVAQAARVAALAEGGEILISEAVTDDVVELDDIVLDAPRAVELRGLSGEHVVTRVDWSP